MRLLLKVSALLLFVGSASAADRFEAARTAIRQQMVADDIPSVAIALSQKGKILWEEGFGWADRERRIAATEHTVYSLASLSKPLTVTGLMTLVQAGKIDLDSAVNDYLGDTKLKVWIGDEKGVTVRRVIDHTSGIVGGGSQFFYGNERFSTPSMEQTIARYGNVVRPPGERYEYSGIGYGVLGYVVERVSGKRFADYMRSDVFLPLGMTRSSMGLDARLEPYWAIRYDLTGQPIPTYDVATPGAGGAFSSAHDLVRFGMFFLKHKSQQQRPILSDAFIDQMTNPAAAADGTSVGNVGWQVSRNGNRLMIGHSGHMPGVTTDLSMIPAEDICVVVLTNASVGTKVHKIREAVVRTVFPQFESKAIRGPLAPATFQPGAPLLGTWQGAIHTYEGEVPVELKILAGGDVHVRFGTQLQTLLNNVTFDNGVLAGSTLSQIETSDTKRHPHNVDISLTLRGDVLNGRASANSTPDPRWNWIYGLPHWMQLRKVSP
jgi:CubicO group peptidase (beta-lactamase class C family)